MSEIQFRVRGHPDGVQFRVSDQQAASFGLGSPVIQPPGDYEKLINKPSMNGVTILGEMILADLFPDGIIVDGGDADGQGDG